LLTPQPIPTQKNTPVEQPVTKVETPTVNTAALYSKKNQGGGGTGTGSGTGTGTGTGPGSGSGTGGGDGSGTGTGTGSGIGPGSGGGTGGGTFSLKGRDAIHKAYPPKGKNIEGKVVVEFTADRNGKVISVNIARGTTINDERIWEECKKAARESKFKAKADAEIEEKGTITYFYVIQ
jgi:TonB family protein